MNRDGKCFSSLESNDKACLPALLREIFEITLNSVECAVINYQQLMWAIEAEGMDIIEICHLEGYLFLIGTWLTFGGSFFSQSSQDIERL